MGLVGSSVDIDASPPPTDLRYATPQTCRFLGLVRCAVSETQWNVEFGRNFVAAQAQRLTVKPGLLGTPHPRKDVCDMIQPGASGMCENEATPLNESQAQAVRAELNSLLESSAFRTSKRCREFLEYIVEHTISGPIGTLKERSIGVEIFRLPQDFDTGQHTIVRVTANEVRKKLAQHYLAENGNYHPVRIHLPPGSYSGEFKWAEAPSARAEAAVEPPSGAVETIPEAHAPRRMRWFNGVVIGCGTAALLIAGAFGMWRSHEVKAITVDAKSPAVAPSAAAVLPVSGDLRLIAGSTNSYLDRSGRTWSPDQFFTGGNVLVRPSERILRTLDPDIYRHLRSGDFRYDIPLAPGNYELHLHFAETGLADFISAESSGEGQRIFRVSENGERILG